MSLIKKTAKAFQKIEDGKHGEWLVVIVNEGWPIDHFFISRFYSSGAQPYGWVRNMDIAKEEIDAYVKEHQKLSTPSKYFVDSAGQNWIVAHNGSDEWYGVTTAYGGLVYYSDSYSELDGAITKFSLDKKKSGEAPPPVPAVPKPSPITDDALRSSAKIAANLGMRLADMLLVEYAESGLNTTKVNPVSGARGLIQIMRGPAHAIGLSDAQYDAIPSMSFDEQQDIARKYFEDIGKRITYGYGDAVSIYKAVFAPFAPGDQLYKQGTRAYEDNKYYDFDHDGWITTADLATVLGRRATEKSYLDIVARVKSLGLGGDPVIGSGGTGASSSLGGSSTFTWILLGAAAGAGVWYFMKNKGSSSSGERAPRSTPAFTAGSDDE